MALQLLVGFLSLAVVVGMKALARPAGAGFAARGAGSESGGGLFGLDDRGVAIVGPINPAAVGRVARRVWPARLPRSARARRRGAADRVRRGPGRRENLCRQTGYTVDPNRELFGLGAANLGAGFASGMVVNGSLSKTAVNGSAGAKNRSAAWWWPTHGIHPAVPHRPVRKTARGDPGRRGDRGGRRTGRIAGLRRLYRVWKRSGSAESTELRPEPISSPRRRP